MATAAVLIFFKYPPALPLGDMIYRNSAELSYGQLRRNLSEVFPELVRQKENKVLEDRLQMILVPPKSSVAQMVGYMKGKRAIHIARNNLGQRKNYSGMHFWARRYSVSTVGADEDVVQVYINNQEKEDQRIEQLSLFKKG